MDENKLTFEAYTLVLKHTIFDGEKEHEVEEPIVIRCSFVTGFWNLKYSLNEMMNRMKQELFSRFSS